MRPFKEGALAKTVNLSQVALKALQTGMCTYVELDTILDLEDALNIIEAHQVLEYNKGKIEHFSRQQ